MYTHITLHVKANLARQSARLNSDLDSAIWNINVVLGAWDRESCNPTFIFPAVEKKISWLPIETLFVNAFQIGNLSI